MEFSVDPSGKVTGASVIKKSGKGPLDSASQDLSDRIIGTAFNVPNAGMKIQVPIRYSLDQRREGASKEAPFLQVYPEYPDLVTCFLFNFFRKLL